MSVQDAGFERGVSFPSNALSDVPFRVYTDPEQYRLEQERIFKGPTWNYLCLAGEIPNPGDWVATTLGEVAVIIARGPDGAVNAFVNRCAHRGNLLCLTNKGHGKEITCIYHGWSYDLEGHLTGVAFERGVKRQGGMPPEFRKDEHHLQRLRVAELCGLVFGTFDEYGDQVSVQILTVFPNMVLQQVRNTIAVRVIRPRAVDKTELDWVHLGFDDDDDAMTERRLRQGNLIGAAGYIALEDGCVGGFVQRALQYNDSDSGVVMMGGHDAESQSFRASEAAIRGFWKKYRALTGA